MEVTIKPDETKYTFDKPMRVKDLLKRLDILPIEALVIRDERILTHDVRLEPDDKVEILLVGSRG